MSGCEADRPNRWHWNQVLTNNTGSRITLTERVNFLNGGHFSTVGNLTINIDPGQSFTHPSAFCSAVNAEQSFRTDWSGSNASGARVAVTGPVVKLNPK